MPFLAKSDYRKHGRIRSFTLIEMLVVVAIIAMLAAVLVPSLKKARDNAKLTACKLNLHDLGIALTAYAMTSNQWFPPTPYIGSTIWLALDNPAADDNLFVLWSARFARNPASFTCPATTHKIRTPSWIEKVPTSLGIKFVIHTEGSPGHVNDFERLGQYSGTKGFGTSYEYSVWCNIPGAKVNINDWWHDSNYKKPYFTDRAPYTLNVLNPAPWKKGLLTDADDSDGMAYSTGFGGITGSNGMAINNFPEPWDNHGIIAMNTVYADGHSETLKMIHYP